jgi:hypothetical protein
MRGFCSEIQRCSCLVCGFGAGLRRIHLVGVEKFGAHRFYLRNRMNISSHHFSLKLR